MGEVKSYCYGCSTHKVLATALRGDYGVCEDCFKTMTPFQVTMLELMSSAVDALWSIQEK